VCEKLARLSWRITVPTRHEVSARHLQMLPTVDIRSADIHDPVALAHLVEGHDAVVNLVAILHGDETAFNRAHVALAQTIAQACILSGVTRLVHVSALGASPKAPSMYQRSKARGELALQSEHLDLTILRPSVIFGAQDKFLNVFAKLQQVFPLIPLAGASTRFQPVWVEDVAQAIVNCLDDAGTSGQTYDLCGPDILSLRQLVEMAGRLGGTNQGKGRPIIELPLVLGRFQAALMSLLPGEPLMSRDNLDSMKVDNVADGLLPGLQALGIDPTPLEVIAPQYLARVARQSVFQSTRSRAGR